MKHLILSLMVFGSFQALSKNCDKTNYKEFIRNKQATKDLIKKTKKFFKGCDLIEADLRWVKLNRAYLKQADLAKAKLT